MATPHGESVKPVRREGRTHVLVIRLVRWIRVGVLILGASALLAGFVGFDALAPPGQARAADHAALDIMPVKPGGPAAGYAAYVPSTVVTLPAGTVATITIRNFDLSASPAPEDFPYAQVQGTVGNVAYADGVAYTAVDSLHIAHTFTVPALHLNVPIPGTSTNGKPYVTVTFRVRIAHPGTYTWRCFAPCGDGPDGQGGPMADDAYMRGILFTDK